MQLWVAGPGEVEQTLMQIDPKALLPPPASASDFFEALAHSKSPAAVQGGSA